MHSPLAVDALQETDIALCAQRLLPIPQKIVKNLISLYIFSHREIIALRTAQVGHNDVRNRRKLPCPCALSQCTGTIP
jgi:hypothetical protein